MDSDTLNLNIEHMKITYENFWQVYIKNSLPVDLTASTLGTFMKVTSFAVNIRMSKCIADNKLGTSSITVLC